MATGFEAVISDMLAELERQRDGLTRLHTSLATVTGSATSPKRQVSVTVDARGEITELKFLGTAYRTMAAQELAEVITATIRDARRDARQQIADQAGDVGVDGARPADLVDNGPDWSAAFADVFTLPPALLDLVSRPPTDLPERLSGEAEQR